MEKVRDFFAVRAPLDGIRRSPGQPVGGVNGLNGQFLRDGGGADESNQENREKEPLHGQSPGREVKRRSVTLADSGQHLSLQSKTIYRNGRNGSQRNQKNG